MPSPQSQAPVAKPGAPAGVSQGTDMGTQAGIPARRKPRDDTDLFFNKFAGLINNKMTVMNNLLLDYIK